MELHCVCLNGYLPIVKYLISKGANIEAKNINNWIPLLYASYYGKIDVVKFLVSKGANKDTTNNFVHE